VNLNLNLNLDQFFQLAVWLKVVIVASLLFLIFKTILKFSLNRYKNTPIDHPQFYRLILKIFASQTRSLFLWVLASYVGVLAFVRSETWSSWAKDVFFLMAMAQLWFWLQSFIGSYVERRTCLLAAEDRSKSTSYRALSFVAYLVVFSLLVLFTLDNFGVNITALIAGLGVGGVAVALAVQNILGDLFASITIILDKPFVVGDLIVVGDVTGRIETIGIKTTRVRSLSGEIVVFSNADLLQSRIRNYHSVYERRVFFTFGVLYETPRHKLAEIPNLVKQIVSEIPKTRLERVHFTRFGESSLDFEVVFYALQADLNFALECQERVNLRLLEEFEKQSIAFAYPTRTLFVRDLARATN
jgi:small-conductance mechanosensitive channel